MWESQEYISYYHKYIAEKGIKFRSENNLLSIKYKLLNRPVLSQLKNPLKFGEILDIGGGGGDNYFTFRKSIKNQFINFYISDNKHLFHSTQVTRNKYSNPNDKFFHVTNLEDISQLNIDITFIIGTLQYLSKKELISVLHKLSKVNHLIIARTPMTCRYKESVQIAQVPFGEQIKLQKVQVYLRSRRELKKLFNSFGFKVKSSGLPIPYFLDTEGGDVPSFYQMIHFYRQN
jgi:putative methyltransferase (TIGR04325 family)